MTTNRHPSPPSRPSSRLFTTEVRRRTILCTPQPAPARLPMSAGSFRHPVRPARGLDLTRAQWSKSTYSSANGACVEVAKNLSGVVAIRDSKDHDGPKLLISPAD